MLLFTSQCIPILGDTPASAHRARATEGFMTLAVNGAV